MPKHANAHCTATAARQKVLDYAVVGGGIGGCCSAALLTHQGKNVHLFEKEPYLGGCSSTFTHKGYRYNSGATTFAMAEKGGVVDAILQPLKLTLPIKLSNPSITILQKGQSILRYQERNAFLESLQKVHPHPSHITFYTEISRIATLFYSLDAYYYSASSLLSKVYSLFSFKELIRQLLRYLYMPARRFFRHFYPQLTKEYLAVLDAQIMIVAQCKSDKLNALTAILALDYPSHNNYTLLGGFDAVFHALQKKITHVWLGSEVQQVERKDNGFILHTNKQSFEANSVILNTPVFSNKKLFSDASVKRYYRSLEPLNNDQSAFVFYMTFKSTKTYAHHYQLLLEERLANTFSDALFISLSDQSDTTLCKEETYSLTASIHTTASFWCTLSKQDYRGKKQHLEQRIQSLVCHALDIQTSTILQSFSATPRTFQHYINRSQLGGIAPVMRRPFFLNPSNNTPFKGLYQVGDTTFAAQGWPGVLMGVRNLMRLLQRETPCH